jgi:hypothetical protein
LEHHVGRHHGFFAGSVGAGVSLLASFSSTPRGMIIDGERLICVVALLLGGGGGGAIEVGGEDGGGALVKGLTFVAAIGGFGGGKGRQMKPIASMNSALRP